MKSTNICRFYETDNDCSALARRISGWIEAHVRRSGMKGVVLGLSGGLDSSVAAALCHAAMGDHSLGLIMPCESTPEDAKDAQLAAATYGVKTVTVDLNGVFKQFLEVLPGSAVPVAANLKSRLRMATLYFWANNLSYLVVGTGNRSELMTGYFTKHGDGAADLLPLGALYKTDIIRLARFLSVPERIIQKPPSAGLWHGQTDEDEMGISYENLDGILMAMESGSATDGADPESRLVEDMVAHSLHKRSTPPVFEARE